MRYVKIEFITGHWPKAVYRMVSVYSKNLAKPLSTKCRQRSVCGSDPTRFKY